MSECQRTHVSVNFLYMLCELGITLFIYVQGVRGPGQDVKY